MEWRAWEAWISLHVQDTGVQHLAGIIAGQRAINTQDSLYHVIFVELFPI